MTKTNTEHTDDPTSGACAGCALSSRRSFLLDLVGLATAVVTSLGIDARVAAALPVDFASGSRLDGDWTYPLPAVDGVTIDRGNSVILARYQGKVFAFSLACPHQNTALRWLQAERRFQCPKHKSKYAPDGTFLSGRATRSMDRFAVRKDGADLIVDPDRIYEQDRNAGEWEAACVDA